MIRRLTIVTLLLLAASVLHAQPPKNLYRIEGSDIVMYLSGTTSRPEQEKFLEQFGMKGLSLDTLWKMGSLGRWARDGWKLSMQGKDGYKIYKSLSDLSGNLNSNNGVVVLNEYWEAILRQTTSTFGSNSFRKLTVSSSKKGMTRFFLYGQLSARDAYLSGTFNGWSTQSTPMVKTDSGWVAEVKLNPGKHCYKFIVGGKWMNDKENLRSEDDFHGGMNSVYFVTNFEFRLSGNENARTVLLTGSFNNWNDKTFTMQRTKDGWRLPVYLKEGSYTYKFIVDGKWITDPANPDSRDNGKGSRNSYVQLGDKSYFKLDGYGSAKRVVVSGNFNDWNENELVMTRTSLGWELPLVLSAGNYQYKFIVDGKWIVDPGSPFTGISDGHVNSLKVVKPNQSFFLKGFTSATAVKLAGSFNDWTDYSMKKIPDGWTIDLFLPPGKYLYKFVVDGKWIIDPGNKLWEQNEHGTGNSVLWIGVQ